MEHERAVEDGNAAQGETQVSSATTVASFGAIDTDGLIRMNDVK
jgi:hypothetical protein